MAYTTRQDMERRYTLELLAELTDDATGQVVDDAILSAILDAASGEADMHLAAAGWTTPVSPVPSWLKTITETIAIYLLYQRRGRIPESVTKDYERALSRLQAIAKQELTVQEDSDLTVETNADEDDLVFTKDKMRGL